MTLETWEVRRPRTRERMLECPNFRDHGKTGDLHLLDVVASLQKKYGQAFASESGPRWSKASSSKCG